VRSLRHLGGSGHHLEMLMGGLCLKPQSLGLGAARSLAATSFGHPALFCFFFLFLLFVNI
jgi:hypothetical protein